MITLVFLSGMVVGFVVGVEDIQEKIFNPALTDITRRWNDGRPIFELYT